MKYDADKILKELYSIPKFKRQEQFVLQGLKDQKDKSYGQGGVQDLEHDEELFIYPLYDIPYTNKIISNLGMYRTRVMCMRAKTCYTLHRDVTERVHIPLKGDLDSCFMLVDEEVVWMKEIGKVYTIDTRKTHTAVNASREVRMHLVGLV
jgi:hypothetical protein